MLIYNEFAFVLLALAAALTLASNLMKRMVPLRILAIASTILFLAYAAMKHDWVNVAMQVALLAVNAYRLWDLHHLLVALASANADTPLKDWLLPYMTKKVFKAGHVIFRKGEPAHDMVYVRKGTIRVEEIGQTLGAGSLVGEIGLFSEDRTRTATVICQTNCICYTMTDEAIYLLYFQNPKLGFFLIRLIVQRLLRDLQRRPESADA